MSEAINLIKAECENSYRVIISGCLLYQGLVDANISKGIKADSYLVKFKPDDVSKATENGFDPDQVYIIAKSIVETVLLKIYRNESYTPVKLGINTFYSGSYSKTPKLRPKE